MLKQNTKLQYTIISDSEPASDTNQNNANNVVYKISVKSYKSYQLPLIKLFTNNAKFLTHLEEHGFLTNRSLSSHIISFLGQLKSQELLKKFDSKTFHKKISPIYCAISKLQEEIKKTQTEEAALKNKKNKLEAEYDFKYKLSSIINDFIYKLKKANRGYYSIVSHHLYNSINLLDGYTFPLSGINSRHQEITAELSENSVWIVDPYKHNRISNYDNLLQFYLAVNHFNDLCSEPEWISKTPKIHLSEIDAINKLRLQYSSTYTINNILDYIKKHKLRSIYTLGLILLEIAFVPVAASFFGGFYLFSLMGFGHSLILITLLIPMTITLVNRSSEIPALFNSLNNKILDIFNKHRQKKLKPHAKSPIEIQYIEKLDGCKEVNPKSKKDKPKSKNLILKIPVISSIFKLLRKQYKNYCNWYFSYIQRNPLAFLIYITLKTTAMFVSALYIPIGNWLFKTYIDIDRSIDQERLASKSGQTLPASNYRVLIKTKQDNNSNTNLLKPKSNKYADIAKHLLRLSTDIFKIVFCKLPLGLIYLSCKLILSSLYSLYYTILYAAALPFRLFGLNKAHHFILNIESAVTKFYYQVYYIYQLYYHQLNLFIDNINPFHIENTSLAENIGEVLINPSNVVIPQQVIDIQTCNNTYQNRREDCALSDTSVSQLFAKFDEHNNSKHHKTSCQ